MQIIYCTLPSCHFFEHMVSIIQMGNAGSSIAIPMFAKQIDPWRRRIDKVVIISFDYGQKAVQRVDALTKNVVFTDLFVMHQILIVK